MSARLRGSRKAAMMRMTRTAAIATAVLAAMAAGPLAQPWGLALGLVRADGILVPFAVFDGEAWIEPWPGPEGGMADIAFDGMIAAVPSIWRNRRQQVPQSWHVLMPGAATREISVLSHVAFDEHCGRQVGLLTDLHPRRADPHEKMLAADRAVAWSVPLDLSEGRERAGWEDFVRLIEAETVRQEGPALASLERAVKRPLQPEPVSERKPVRIRRLHADRESGSRIVYFEAERHYAQPLWDAPPGESFLLFVSGWVYHATGSEPSVHGTRAVVDDSSLKSIVRVKPVGIVRAGGPPLWVTQSHGYESEAVSLLRIDGTGVQEVFTRFIGGC
jgi:hypothetical protein